MKLSIITPSYNQGRFIEKCLSSVSSQLGDFAVEHIVLDNHSVDSTEKSLKDYQVKSSCVDVRVFIEPDGGQTHAINKGLSLATGDIVCWLNTDEWYEEGALAKVVDYFSKHPDIDVVFGDCNFVDVAGQIVRQKRELFFNKSMLLYFGCFIPSCSTFVRRRVIDDGYILDPAFKVTMDFDWYVRIANAGYRFAHLPEILADFTWHDTNISVNYSNQRHIERRLVQDRNSFLIGPNWLRTIIYKLSYYFWIFVRVSLRVIIRPFKSQLTQHYQTKCK